jgi:hypothetical protein
VSNRYNPLRVADCCDYLYPQTDSKTMHLQGEACTRDKSPDTNTGTPKRHCTHHANPRHSRSVAFDTVSIDQVTLGNFECMIQDTVEAFDIGSVYIPLKDTTLFTISSIAIVFSASWTRSRTCALQVIQIAPSPLFQQPIVITTLTVHRPSLQATALVTKRISRPTTQNQSPRPTHKRLRC